MISGGFCIHGIVMQFVEYKICVFHMLNPIYYHQASVKRCAMKDGAPEALKAGNLEKNFLHLT